MACQKFRRVSSWLLMMALLWTDAVLAAVGPPNGPPSIAPQYLINAWDTERGLPHNSVSSIAQTKTGPGAGYLWVGTYNGLARFDGMRFTVFDQESTPGLRSDRILKLLHDRQGALWIGTEGGGVSRYHNGQFERVALTRELGRSSITGLAEDRQGAMWFGTSTGELYRYHHQELQTFNAEHGLPKDASLSVVEDGDGMLWAYSPDYLGYFHEGRFVTCKQEPGSRMEVAPASDGGLWVASKGRLQKYRAGHISLDCGRVSIFVGVSFRAIYEDRKGNVWLGTAGRGLFRYREGRFQPITTRGGLSSDIIWSIFEDAERNLWVGTHGGGINRIAERLFDVFDSSNGLTDNNVTSLTADRNNVIWAGTGEGGLNFLRGDRWTAIPQKEGSVTDDVCAVATDRTGALWVGTWGSGLFRMTNGVFQRFTRENTPGLPSDIIRAIYEDRQGVMWFGTYDEGVLRYVDGKFTQLSRTDGLPHNDVRVIHEDRAGSIWLGTGGGGICCYTNKQFITYRQPEGLTSDFVRAIYEDQSGAIWIGTGGGGLCRLKEGKITSFSERDGLVDASISQIFEDHRGYFWIGCNKGVMRIKRSELDGVAERLTDDLSVVWYNQLDGLNRCNGGFQSSGCRTSDGRLWFPTVRGAAVVDPNNLRINLRAPQVIIEELAIDGVPHDISARVVAPPGRERYDFHFTGISFSAPERVHFRFKLEGLDQDWVEAGTRRVAYYSHLPPGRYRFLVNAANRDGIWSTEAAVLRLTVLAPFWRTWWFIVSSIVALMVVVAATARFVAMRRLEQKLAALRHQTAIERERARIAQDMHDDLGASLTQIALLSELGQRHLSDADEVRAQLLRIAGKSREVVNSLDEIVWAVNPRNDTARSLIEYLAYYVDEYLEEAGIRSWQEVPEELPHHRVNAEARHNTYLVVKEALNNVAKHAQATEVWFRVVLDGTKLTIVIEDNGRGFATQGTGSKGNGLWNMEKRIKDIGGRFHLTSQPGRGTRLEFSVEIGQP